MNKTLDIASRYTYRVAWSAEDEEYVATSVEFPSLSHLDPDQAAALGGIRALVTQVIADMRATGEAVPPPISDTHYSGQFLTRVPKELHARLALEAREAGISLNRLVSYKLASPAPAAPPGKAARRKASAS